MIKIAINGFGRIGRLCFRETFGSREFEVVAINDLTDAHTLAHLLKYDTAHGRYRKDEISNTSHSIIVGDNEVEVYSEKEPALLPWRRLDIDVVFECTGLFTSYDKAIAHIDAGAKKVIISAPAKGELKTIVYNVNHHILDGTEKIISAASCTTNCLAPVAKIINDNFGIKKGFMTTVHAYTNDQATLDVTHKKGIKARRGRAAAENIVPATTGAASALGLVLPELAGKLDGMALRVPVPTGSIVDLSLELSKNTTNDEVNNVFKNNINETIGYTEDPIVSSDIIGIRYGSLVDGLSTQVLETEDGNQMLKVLAWYDNEMSYSAQMVRTAKYWMSL